MFFYFSFNIIIFYNKYLYTLLILKYLYWKLLDIKTIVVTIIHIIVY